MKTFSNFKLGVLAPMVLVVVMVLWLLPADSFGIEGLTVVQQRTIAIFCYAALMWMFEIIPAWATSVTTVVFLLLAVSDQGFTMGTQGDLVDYRLLMASFADPVIMLFLGGFVLAISASKVGLDIFLARVMLKPFGTKPKYVLLGFLIVIGMLSMFMSNTATAAMMLAFLTPVLKTLPENGGGRTSLAMSIPIAANIGGMGTPIGTPPNSIAIGQLGQLGINIGFDTWMIRMVPVVIVMLLISWQVLMRLFPFKAKSIEIKIEGECNKDINYWTVTVTFLLTILLWMTGELTHINANVVALVPFAVFAFTGIFKRADFAKIDWHVLWMVAGGFALGTALNKTGLAAAMVASFPFSEWSVVVVLIVSGLLGYVLSNFIANSSAANLLVPILAVVGTAMADNLAVYGGVTTLLVCVAASTSFAMLFPISTPPNAIASSTGLIKTHDMTLVGIIVGVIGLILSYTVLLLFPF
jgi:sodium-dependent dicarboxylate transporter 2/3/5